MASSHLTAFDLTLFHNFGAKYPDAQYLDALLTTYLAPDRGSRPTHPANRRRLATHLGTQAHAAPRTASSLPGTATISRTSRAGTHNLDGRESARTARRRTRTCPRNKSPTSHNDAQPFAGNPIDPSIRDNAALALQQAIDDLGHDLELRELGMATFLDRPLGILKQPGEVDRTPLVAYEAFSRDAARRRLEQLKSVGWLS